MWIVLWREREGRRRRGEGERERRSSADRIALAHAGKVWWWHILTSHWGYHIPSQDLIYILKLRRGGEERRKEKKREVWDLVFTRHPCTLCLSLVSYSCCFLLWAYKVPHLFPPLASSSLFSIVLVNYYYSTCSDVSHTPHSLGCHL